jgi:hypothetical protein
VHQRFARKGIENRSECAVENFVHVICLLQQ